LTGALATLQLEDAELRLTAEPFDVPVACRNRLVAFSGETVLPPLDVVVVVLLDELLLELELLDELLLELELLLLELDAPVLAVPCGQKSTVKFPPVGVVCRPTLSSYA